MPFLHLEGTDEDAHGCEGLGLLNGCTGAPHGEGVQGGGCEAHTPTPHRPGSAV